MFVIWLVHSAEANWYAKWYEEIQLKQLIPIDVRRFYLNKSLENHFKLLEVSTNWIIVGGRNAVYNVSLNDMKENEPNRIEWDVEPKEKESCVLRGKKNDDCQNYIGVRVKVDQNRTLVCGTNAYQPSCRIHGINPEVYLRVPGIAISPHDPSDRSTVVFSNGMLFSATSSDLFGDDRAINRFTLTQGDWQGRIRTGTKLDGDRLNDDTVFIESLDMNEHIYFFFREFANEKRDCKNMVSSRIGRVCKQDSGGHLDFRQSYKLWTSFQKVRLSCFIPGDSSFEFDEIQSVSNLVKGVYGQKEEQLIYGLFTTPKNSIPASAICAFRINDIKAAFDGYYQAEVSRATDPNFSFPVPRFTCNTKSFSVAPANIDFFSYHSLMQQKVQPFYGQPVVTHASLKHRFTKLIVDPQVPTSNNQAYDVLIMATDRGTVIRAVNVEAYSSSSRVTPIVIEEMRVFEEGEAITDLKLVPRTKRGGQRPRLLVVSNNEIRNVPLGRCADASGCSECLALHDPYCAWNPTTWRCVVFDPSKQNLIQAIKDGYSNLCPDKTKVFTAQMDVRIRSDPNVGCYCALDPSASKCLSFNSTESFSMYNIMKSIAVVNHEKIRKSGRGRNPATKNQSISVWKLLVLCIAPFFIIN